MVMPIRRTLGNVAVGMSALTVSACFSFDAKPFSLAIPAQQLRISDVMIPGIDSTSANAPAFAEARIEDTSEPQPENVAIPGQAELVSAEADSNHPVTARDTGIDPMSRDRIVVTARRDISRRVPDYSPEETASLICVMQKIGFDDGNARRAHEATLAARDMREAFAAGQVTIGHADEIERKRQDAVWSALSPLPFLDLFYSPIVRRKDLPAPTYKGANLEQIDVTYSVENGRNVIVVSGVARNTGRAEVELPPVTLEALDAWDFVLSGQSSLLPFSWLAPGAAKSFEIRLLNPPENVTEVYVHFAPPFRYRWRRDCDFFDPGRSTVNDRLTDLPASDSKSIWGIIDDQLDAYQLATSPEVAPGAAPNAYSAAELNTLTRYFRREAAWAWECREAAKPECAGADERLHWRDMFAIAESIDEAWVALSAYEATQMANSVETNGSGELAAAAGAYQSAITTFTTLGSAALRRAGTSVPDVNVELTTSVLNLDQAGLYLQVAGRMINTGGDTRFVDALLVALVDRFELPLSSVTVSSSTTLAPGQSQEFSQRIPVMRGGSRPALSTSNTGTIGRVPPEEIPWQIRVGAMSKLN
jgi:hypothetical protein